jgi:hypothetical protein
MANHVFMYPKVTPVAATGGGSRGASGAAQPKPRG